MDTYSVLKGFHIIGAILFIGNITVTGWWKWQADRTGNPEVIAFAQRQVTLTDFVFTAGGAFLLGAVGIYTARAFDMPYVRISEVVTGTINPDASSWLSWGYWLFILSGIIWVIALIPLQVILARMAKTFQSGREIPARYWKLNRCWFIFGWTATIIPAAVVFLMVMKPEG